MRREKERGRPDFMCGRERNRQTESFHVLFLHIFLDKLEHNKVPSFVNFDIRELDVSSLLSTHLKSDQQQTVGSPPRTLRYCDVTVSTVCQLLHANSAAACTKTHVHSSCCFSLLLLAAPEFLELKRRLAFKFRCS
jgi:hypothetical protein